MVVCLKRLIRLAIGKELTRVGSVIQRVRLRRFAGLGNAQVGCSAVLFRCALIFHTAMISEMARGVTPRKKIDFGGVSIYP